MNTYLVGQLDNTLDALHGADLEQHVNGCIRYMLTPTKNNTTICG